MLSGDRHAIFAKATVLAARVYPLLKLDIKKVNDELEGYARYEYKKVVTGDDDLVAGALIAHNAPNLWAQRQHAAILLWYSDIPGGGAALLRDFKRYVQSSRRIRVAGFAHDSDEMDPTMLKLAERIGFKKHGGGAYMLYN